MAGFPRAQRQRIIDEYLQASGRNLFQPGEFIDWLKDRPNHVAYDLFYGQSDEDAAREHRIGLARQMASGLRIVARITATTESMVGVRVHEFPAFVSPMGGRHNGGGYVVFDPHDEAMLTELGRQGAQALQSWLARYRGVAELSGLDVGPIEEIAALMNGRVVDAA